MKDNPQMMATAQKLMSNMTPEQMLEQSRAAQEKMQRYDATLSTYARADSGGP